MRFAIRDKQGVTGPDDFLAMPKFDFNSAVDDVTDMAPIAPMLRHCLGILHQSQYA
jgi:hypothetical protein